MMNDLELASLEKICDMVDDCVKSAKEKEIGDLVISVVLIKKAGELLYKHCDYDASAYELLLNDNIVALREHLTANKKGTDDVKI